MSGENSPHNFLTTWRSTWKREIHSTIFSRPGEAPGSARSTPLVTHRKDACSKRREALMEPARAKIVAFPLPEAEQWIEEYRQAPLGGRDKDTVDAYVRVLRKFTIWMSEQPGHDHQFHPEYITRTLVEIFLDKLPSASYKNQARSALSGFCGWLMEDRQLLSRNPTR